MNKDGWNSKSNPVMYKNDHTWWPGIKDWFNILKKISNFISCMNKEKLFNLRDL